MSAWAEMPHDWVQNSEEKQMTVQLIWDLLAAFDCVDADLLNQ